MATIELPQGDTEERARFWGLRPAVAEAVTAYSAAIDTALTLSVGESEAARMAIAYANDCTICRTARVDGAEARGLDEDWYGGIADPARRGSYAPREAMAIEFAERFAAGRTAFDDDHWTRLQAAFSAPEILELAALCGKALGLGRVTAVFDIETTCALTVPVTRAEAHR